MALFPVVMLVPRNRGYLPAKEKTALLNRVSREALRLSAWKSGVVLGELAKDERDAPLPCGSYYRSVSHKPEYVAAVVSRSPVGIDIEQMEPRASSLLSYVVRDEEWELGGGKSWDTFFRYWTAKEAVLKAHGIGLGGLKGCRVTSVPDDAHLVLRYQDRLHQVEQLRYRNHLVAVLQNANEVVWITPEET